MTDRDYFAAAALAGYNANGTWDDADSQIVAERAYVDADAMLRERGKAVRDNCVSGNNPEIGCPPTLTDEEREAVEWFASLSWGDVAQDGHHAATLRSLLERTK
jgi:hypothetical protein